MRTAPGQHAFMRLDRAGESAFAMPKKLRLNERLGKLREVKSYEAVRKTFGKTPALFVEGNIARPANSRRRCTFAGTGLSQQQRREIFHAIPQIAVVQLHLLRKDILPEMPPEFLHAVALPDQPPDDDMKRPPQLIENL